MLLAVGRWALVPTWLLFLVLGRQLVWWSRLAAVLPRQAHDCDERQVAGGATARRHEQGDFGSDVEAEPEQATQGYMCHGFVTALVARPYKRLMNRRELSRSSSSVSS